MGILNELIFTIFQIFRWWNERNNNHFFNSRLLTRYRLFIYFSIFRKWSSNDFTNESKTHFSRMRIFPFRIVVGKIRQFFVSPIQWFWIGKFFWWGKKIIFTLNKWAMNTLTIAWTFSTCCIINNHLLIGSPIFIILYIVCIPLIRWIMAITWKKESIFKCDTHTSVPILIPIHIRFKCMFNVFHHFTVFDHTFKLLITHDHVYATRDQRTYINTSIYVCACESASSSTICIHNAPEYHKAPVTQQIQFKKSVTEFQFAIDLFNTRIRFVSNTSFLIQVCALR